MILFPQETIVNKIIPKNKFYEKANISTKLKNSFVNDIDKIIWSNKIAPTTLKGISNNNSNIPEIEVFTIKLKNNDFDTKILETIDESIPQYIIFLLERDNFFKIAIAFKEKDANFNNKITIKRYFYTDWVEEPNLEICGNTITAIYENFIKQITTEFDEIDGEIDFKEQVERTIKINKINSEIAKLKIKMKREPQFNRKCEINRNIKILLKELENLKSK